MPIKGVEQQAVLVMHRVRSVLVRQRTMMANALRGHMAEFGIIAPQGLKAVRELGRLLEDPQVRVPDAARATLRTLIGQMAETSPDRGDALMFKSTVSKFFLTSALFAALAAAAVFGTLAQRAAQSAATHMSNQLTSRTFDLRVETTTKTGAAWTTTCGIAPAILRPSAWAVAGKRD